MATYSQEPHRPAEYIPPQYGPPTTSPKAAPATYVPPGHQGAAAKGLAQTFGLDIRTAILTVIVDLMLFGGDVVSLGALVPLEFIVGGVLGVIAYKIQKKWYGDDHDSALIKALIVGLLTAIPAPITPIIAIPGGILGLINMSRKK